MLIQILIQCDRLNEASPIILICPFLCRQTTVDIERGTIWRKPTMRTSLLLHQVLGAIRDLPASRALAVQLQVPSMTKTQLLNTRTECRWVKLFDLVWVMMVALHHVMWVWNPWRTELHVVMLWCLPTDMRKGGWRIISWFTLPRKKQSLSSKQVTEDTWLETIWRRSTKVQQPSR